MRMPSVGTNRLGTLPPCAALDILVLTAWKNATVGASGKANRALAFFRLGAPITIGGWDASG